MSREADVLIVSKSLLAAASPACCGICIPYGDCMSHILYPQCTLNSRFLKNKGVSELLTGWNKIFVPLRDGENSFKHESSCNKQWSKFKNNTSDSRAFVDELSQICQLFEGQVEASSVTSVLSACTTRSSKHVSISIHPKCIFASVVSQRGNKIPSQKELKSFASR